MLVSTKGRYALRMMLQLAETPDKPVRIKEVASCQDISPKYLEQIMIVLKSSGFVDSMRGPRGGYTLARDPKEITAGSIIRAMEGNLSIDCVITKGESCPRSADCKAHMLWNKIDRAVSDIIDTVTLYDMVQWVPDKRIDIL
ncbi:MAG: Rrf2 family transcriptional regulator [Candidatus Methanomethylophilaceae archaeon]|nr:Rrf2 family transcriptional regulator [Candidatus Methanomethylophilaceae archaeon]